MSQIFVPTVYLAGQPHHWWPKVVDGAEVTLGPLRMIVETKDSAGVWSKAKVSKPEPGTLISYIAASPETQYRVRIDNTAVGSAHAPYQDSCSVKILPDGREMPANNGIYLWPQTRLVCEGWRNDFANTTSISKPFVWETPAENSSSSSSSSASASGGGGAVAGKIVVACSAIRRTSITPYTATWGARSTGSEASAAAAAPPGKKAKVFNLQTEAPGSTHVGAAQMTRDFTTEDICTLPEVTFYYRDECALELQGIYQVPRGPASLAAAAAAGAGSSNSKNGKGSDVKPQIGASSSLSSSSSSQLSGSKRKSSSSSSKPEAKQQDVNTLAYFDLSQGRGGGDDDDDDDDDDGSYAASADDCVEVRVATAGGSQLSATRILIPVLKAGTKLGFSQGADGALVIDDDDDDDGGSKKSKAPPAKRSKHENSNNKGSVVDSTRPALWYTMDHLFAAVHAAMDAEGGDKDTRVVSLDAARAFAAGVLRGKKGKASSSSSSSSSSSAAAKFEELQKSVAKGRLFSCNGKTIDDVAAAIKEGAVLPLVVSFTGKTAAFKPLHDLKPGDVL